MKRILPLWLNSLMPRVEIPLLPIWGDGIISQYAPFHTKVINSTVRNATHVLDGLLYHESDLRIEEHYTDTVGFTDHVFGLMHLLGFQFAPRIRDLADKRLYINGDAKQYPTLIHLSTAISM